MKNVVPDEGQWGQGVASKKEEYSHDLITEQALAFVDRAKDRPFFLYLPWTIPHANNEAGKKGMEVPGCVKRRDTAGIFGQENSTRSTGGAPANRRSVFKLFCSRRS